MHVATAPMPDTSLSSSANEAAAVSLTSYGDPNSAKVDEDDGSRLGRSLALPFSLWRFYCRKCVFSLGDC